MFLTVFLSSVMAGAVMSLLYAIRAEDQVLRVISKTAASAAFVGLGFLRWAPGDTVATWIVAALVLCAVGDLCLIWDRSFDIGLIAFLAGHLAYVAAFHTALPIGQWSRLIVLPLVAAAVVVGRWWLWPHLGKRRIPVSLYIVAISLMVWGAVSTVVAGALPWTAAAGAIFFYLSDLSVARERFVDSDFINRALGLPAYYLGQFLLAMTISAGSL